MNTPSISYGDNVKELLADKEFNVIRRDDQRFPYLGVAYIEWKGERPMKSKLQLSLSCHECGGQMTCEVSSWTGFWQALENCPLCGITIEIASGRGWESGFRPGAFVYAMPYTRTNGARARAIELRVVDVWETE